MYLCCGSLKEEIEVLDILKGHDRKWITYFVELEYLLSETSRLFFFQPSPNQNLEIESLRMV